MKRNLFSAALFFSFTMTFAQSAIQSQLLLVNAAIPSYSLTHDVKYDDLYDDGVEDYFITLNSGTAYTISAVCDEDCDDLDIRLYDQNGNLVDSDTDADSIPVVEVSPRWTGRFKLRVTMCDCDVEPCKIGIGIFGN